MAQYYYSLPVYDFTKLNSIIEELNNVPEYQRDYLPEALRNPIKELINIIKSNAPVCLDPNTGNVTIDQIRFYAYKEFYKKNETKAREGVVKKFIEGVNEPVKSFAEDKVKDLDWENDKDFRKAMEDILTEYEAHSAYDPEIFPPYGMIFRHTFMMNITPQGIEASVVSDGLKNYFEDKEYQKEHMKNVSDRYDEIVKENGTDLSVVDKNDLIFVEGKDNPFFECFRDANGTYGTAGLQKRISDRAMAYQAINNNMEIER